MGHAILLSLKISLCLFTLPILTALTGQLGLPLTSEFSMEVLHSVLSIFLWYLQGEFVLPSRAS